MIATLTFNPVDCIYFVPAGPTFKADIHVTNASTSSFAVFKVKTNKADRYTVKPHIGLLAPAETKVVTFSVQPSQLDAFLEDMVRQQGALDGKLQTAFLVLMWSLPEEIVPQLALAPKDTMSATLQHFWKEQEAKDKATNSLSFSQKKFPARFYDGTEASEGAEASVAPAATPTATPSAAAAAAPAAAARTDGDPTAPASVSRPTPAPKETELAPALAAASALRSAATLASLPSTTLLVAARHDAGADAASAAATAAAPPSASTNPAAAPAAAALPGMSYEEAVSLRSRANELSSAMLGLQGERDGLRGALDHRERELQTLRGRLQEAEAAAAAAAMERAQQLASAGLKSRGHGASAADDDEEPAAAAPAAAPAGFSLWVLLLVALVLFLLGRLSVEWL